MPADRPRVVAATPAYNEEKTIAKVVVRAMKYVDKVIVVDDGSTDDTAMIAQRLGAHVVRHERNLGYGAAIQSCFNAARDLDADIMVVLDADGQHSADDIPALLASVRGGEADIVVGSRFAAGGTSEIPPYRRAGLRIINEATNRVAEVKISDTQSGFRAYSRRAIQLIRPYEQGMGVTSEISVRAGDMGLKVTEVPIRVAYSGLESSSQNPLMHALEILSATLRIAGEKHPVLLIGAPGLLLIVAGLTGWLWTAQRFAQIQQLPLGTALISTLMLIAGIVSVNTAIILYTIANVSRRLT
jgi:glycosyltransferase involved in cell wall biosynthesis